MKTSLMEDCKKFVAQEVAARLETNKANTERCISSVANSPKASGGSSLSLDMTTAAVKRLTNDRLRVLLEEAKQNTSGNKPALVKRVLSCYETTDQR